jgi:hypothetical protein
MATTTEDLLSNSTPENHRFRIEQVVDVQVGLRFVGPIGTQQIGLRIAAGISAELRGEKKVFLTALPYEETK